MMMMRQTIGSLLALGLLASCGEAPPPSSPSAVAAAPQRSSLQPGDVHRYAFSWSVSAKGQADMLAGTEVGGDVALDGTLRLTVYDVTPEGVSVGVRFDELTAAQIAVLGHNVLADRSPLLGHEAMVVLPSSGRPREVYFAPEATPIFRNLMRGMLAHVDLVVPAGTDDFSRVGPTGNGLATLDYRAVPGNDHVLERTVRGYERVDAFDVGVSADAWDVQSNGRISLGRAGLAESVEFEETLALVPRELGITFGADTRFSMHRTDQRREEPPPLPSLASWTTEDLFEAPDRTEAEREMARKFAEGLTMSDVHVQISTATAGVPAPDGFFVQARGLLRGWPALADDLRGAFERHDDLGTREFVFDLLVSADTPQSQSVLTDLTLDALETAPEQVPQLIQHFALLRSPTAELATTVLDLHRAAEDGEDPMLRAATLYPMGSMAAQIQFREPALAERMLAVLREELGLADTPLEVRSALAGLGNAARAEDFDRVRAHITHADDDVRMQVASALRHARDDEGTDALFDLLADPSRDVAASALSVIDAYRQDDESLHRLAADVIAGVVHPELSGPVIGVLARRGLDDDLALEALGVLYERSNDGHERVRIARILDAQPEPS